MRGRAALQITGVSMVIGVTLGASLVASTPAKAVTFGSNLATTANDSVCEFQSLEPETRVCTVGQHDLLAGHTATGGLVAPFDGVIVRWSVLSGTASPGTGTVKLALRAMSGPGYLRKGPEVELPPSPPGTRYTYVERMSIGAGQPIGVKVTVSNRSTQEASAPIAFREEGVGTIDTWTGEPWESIWTTEEDVELLLDAEIEPDADRDGYGDLTQDCFPNSAGSQELCGRDLEAPTIWPRFAARQAFLRSGAILVRVASNEAGLASAEGRLEIKGRGGWTYGLRGARRPVAVDGQAALLRLRVRKRALKAARAAVREGRKILVTVLVGVADAAGNERQATARIRPR